MALPKKYCLKISLGKPSCRSVAVSGQNSCCSSVKLSRPKVARAQPCLEAETCGPLLPFLKNCAQPPSCHTIRQFFSDTLCLWRSSPESSQIRSKRLHTHKPTHSTGGCSWGFVWLAKPLPAEWRNPSTQSHPRLDRGIPPDPGPPSGEAKVLSPYARPCPADPGNPL